MNEKSSNKDEKLRNLRNFYRDYLIETLNMRTYFMAKGLADGDNYSRSMIAMTESYVNKLKKLAIDEEGLEHGKIKIDHADMTEDTKWQIRDTIAYASLMIEGRKENPDRDKMIYARRMLKAVQAHYDDLWDREKLIRNKYDHLLEIRKVIQSHVRQADILLEEN